MLEKKNAEQRRGGIADFSSHALLHERTELALIVDLDQLLRPIGRVGDVELHLDGVARSRRGREGCRQSRRVGGRSRSHSCVGNFGCGRGVARFPCVWAAD